MQSLARHPSCRNQHLLSPSPNKSTTSASNAVSPISGGQIRCLCPSIVVQVSCWCELTTQMLTARAQHSPARSIARLYSRGMVRLRRRRLGHQLKEHSSLERSQSIDPFHGGGPTPHPSDRAHVLRGHRMAMWPMRARMHRLYTQRRRERNENYVGDWSAFLSRLANGTRLV